MDEKPSTNHRDYFIKDGRFIGAFDEMYRNCADPWEQDEGPFLDEEIALTLLAQRTAPRRILDLGCGKGRFSDRLRQATGASVVATDISPVAVTSAARRFPEVAFLPAQAPLLPFAGGYFDLVVSSGLLWCVIGELPQLFAEIRRISADGGRYLVLETFYQPGQQHYGNEIMERPEDLLRQMPFRLLDLAEVNRTTNWRMIALFEAWAGEG